MARMEKDKRTRWTRRGEHGREWKALDRRRIRRKANAEVRAERARR